MDGWRIRHGLGSEREYQWIAAGLVIAGGAVAVAVRGVGDLIAHHHSAKVRHPADRWVSHRH